VETLTDSLTDFFESAQPRLKHALVAAYGSEVGIEATADALAHGWQHWERVRDMENPIGYLYRVGRSRSRRFRYRTPVLPTVQANPLPWVEPGLPAALARLSVRQRVAVVLLHCLDWSYREVAELFGTSLGTVQSHERRGLERLRTKLGGHA
jgi:RNA polymerase sigma-70 factor (ECF subfamily)